VSVLSDGLGSGLTTVATFMPPIFMIFLCLSLLEESGYMARAAFIMDRFLNAIGLPGKAFIPLLVGFGCTVPALMATRTLEQRRDRVLTMLIAAVHVVRGAYAGVCDFRDGVFSAARQCGDFSRST